MENDTKSKWNVVHNKCQFLSVCVIIYSSKHIFQTYIHNNCMTHRIAQFELFISYQKKGQWWAMEKIKNNIHFSSNMDNFIVKRIIKRVDMHIASLQCTKKWSNLDYYALKDPIFSKKNQLGNRRCHWNKG